MTSYLARRILQLAPVIFVALIINFGLIQGSPGDPAIVIAGENASPEYIEEVRRIYGLNEPFITQLYKYLSRVLVGDFGYSFMYRAPVIDLVLEKAKNTLVIVATSQFIASVLGVCLGTIAAAYRDKLVDKTIVYSTLLLYCTPVFWLGLLLILLFSVNFPIFPVSGMVSLYAPGTPYILDVAYHAVLPVTCLALYTLPTYVRLTRSSILSISSEDYIRTAQAIGYSDRKVYFSHALRNALLPIITIIGMSISSMLSGTLLVETVFSWPGLGRLMYESVDNRDYPVLMGCFLMAMIIVSVTNIIVDTLYVALDPRVRLK